jgi:hypothetical protein
MATEDQGIATEQLGIANEQDLLATATQNAANTQLPEISSAHWCRASRRRGRCSSAPQRLQLLPSWAQQQAPSATPTASVGCTDGRVAGALQRQLAAIRGE